MAYQECDKCAQWMPKEKLIQYLGKDYCSECLEDKRRSPFSDKNSADYPRGADAVRWWKQNRT
jgi:hypothetical protein